MSINEKETPNIEEMEEKVEPAEEAEKPAEPVTEAGEGKEPGKKERKKESKKELKEEKLKVARLENDLSQAIKTRDEYLDMARRIQADFENFKRRNAATRADAFEDGRKEVVNGILPVLDNLERALDASGDAGSIGEGVEKVLKQFKSILEGMGLKEIEAKGQPFDPELHHAVMQEEAEGVEEGTVLEVLQKGYRFNDAIIRYSMVKVAK